ncbi:MAG: S-methyl-5-thioribose-1-phosphate isomerase [Dehalococcoidia bacterium]|nr:MAG: S-methyl-5-thioribose-1-phosphate isomerase [Dehalococcoidia bacterium]
MKVNGKHYRTIWMEGRVVKTIEQRLLPHKFEIVDLSDHRSTAVAINTMVIRGAGAIGAAAAYGMAQIALEAPALDFWDYVNQGAETIKRTRPTAQNLFYAVDKVFNAMQAASGIQQARDIAQEMAQQIADDDAAACQSIGNYGAELIKDGARILTHCNAGWLAFVDWGSALSPIYVAARQGKRVFVYVDETRPLCQGARLTAWELHGEGIEHVIIADNAAGHFMRHGDIDLVITGSDRIAANGDVANKIGTYEKAVLAHENGIPFYVAAPSSTIDLNCPGGDAIPIEERSEEEVLTAFGLTKDGISTSVLISYTGAHARNPAFDVTPAHYVTRIITEAGIQIPHRINAAKPA